MKSITTLIISLFLSASAFTGFAQTQNLLENDSLLKYYLHQSKYDIDTSALAIVLYEKGTLDLKDFEEFSNTIDNYTAEYTIVKALKILDPAALKEAVINLPFSYGLSVKDIKATVVNLEKNQVSIHDINKNDIIRENLSANVNVCKLNLATTKVGSIIFYTFKYKIDLSHTSEHFELTWNFQTRYPVLNSAFELIISPETYYKDIPKNIEFKACASEKELWAADAGVFSNIQKRRMNFEDKVNITKLWHKTNIPATTSEHYLLNPDDYLQKLNLTIINGDRYLYRQAKVMPKTWDSANKIFYYENINFGKLPFANVVVKDTTLDKLKAQYKEPLQLAKVLYRYFRDSIKVTGMPNTLDEYMKITKEGRKRRKSYNQNLQLTQILRHAGLKAFPVILSTTDNEKLLPDVFEPGKINCVVSLVVVGDHHYFLDASSDYLPFGVLKPECYNDFGWLINEQGMPVAMNANNLSDKNTCMASLVPAERKGTFLLKMDQKMGNVTGPVIRAFWQKDSLNTWKLFDKEIEKMGYKIKILDRSMVNASNPDTPLIVSYKLELELAESGEFIYLNPFFKPLIKTNPFVDKERKYPVEFANASNSQYILKFTLPEGYTLEDYENTTNLSFKNGAMLYSRSMVYDPGKRSFSLNNSLSSNTTRVAPEDYKELRSFYETVTADQNKTIVLKKVH